MTADNKVETRTFPSSSLSGNNWLVTEAVADGDQLILDGFQWVTDGASVKPVPAEVDSKGFVIEKPADANANAPAPKS